MTNMIGKTAPDFTSHAIMPDGQVRFDFNFNQFRGNRPALIFFYALNFSYVCPTELIALHNRRAYFEQKGIAVCAISADSHLAHQEYLRKDMSVGGLRGFTFPLIADITKVIITGYDVMINDSIATRATFITDPQGAVRFQQFHDFPFARNMDEIIRCFDMLQHYERTAQMCPAGWQPGKPGLLPSQQALADFIAQKPEAL